MILQEFIKSQEWQEIRAFLLAQLVDKPLTIKTEGKNIESIALEVRASQLAADKVIKAIRRLERMGGKSKVEAKPFR